MKNSKKQGATARMFYMDYKKACSYKKPYVYRPLWPELMGLFETELFKHPK